MGKHSRSRQPLASQPQERWSPWMTVVVVALAVGAGVAAWQVFGGGGGDTLRPPGASPTASAPAGPPATKAEAARFASRFAQARVNHRPVDRFVTKELAQRYATHRGGLDLYEYTWADKPRSDIVGYSIFHVESLGGGQYLVAVNLQVQASFQASREEVLVVGPGVDAKGRMRRLVIRQAQLPGA